MKNNGRLISEIWKPRVQYLGGIYEAGNPPKVSPPRQNRVLGPPVEQITPLAPFISKVAGSNQDSG